MSDKSDGPAFAMVHQTLQCSPGIEQSHSVVIDDIAVLIARVLFVSRLKCKRSVNEIEVQILELESVQARLESRFDTLGPMIGVPQLRGHKDVFARDPPSGTFLPATPRLPRARFRIAPHNRSVEIRLPARTLVAVMVSAGSGIRVPKPSAGMWPLPLLSGILVSRRSGDSVMVTPLCIGFASIGPRSREAAAPRLRSARLGCSRHSSDS